MTEPIRTLDEQDEPALLRDQFRQLLRYRTLLVTGVLLGLLGSGWLALSGEDTYAATGEVSVRSAASDPFAAGASADKGINIGSERQTAVSDAVGTIAAGTLAKQGDTVEVGALLSGLQVTNPPNTLVLKFAYTGRTPEEARARAQALAGHTWRYGASAPRTASTTWSTATAPSSNRSPNSATASPSRRPEQAATTSPAHAPTSSSPSPRSTRRSPNSAPWTPHPATSTRSPSPRSTPPGPGCRCCSDSAASWESPSGC